MKDILQSSKFRAILWILGGLIVLLVVFGFGVTVGYHEAGFAGRFGANYYSLFYGPSAGSPFFNQHGVAGEIIDLTSSTVSVKDYDGDEHSVLVLPGTSIRAGDTTITSGDLQVGDIITVIGAPNQSGQVAAMFIRVFSASSSAPIPPPVPGNSFN